MREKGGAMKRREDRRSWRVVCCYGATTRRKKGAEEVCGGCGRVGKKGREGKGRRSRGCGGIRSRGVIWPLDGLLGHWELHKWWPISQLLLFFLLNKCRPVDFSFPAMFEASSCLALPLALGA